MPPNIREFTKDEAIAIYDSGLWEFVPIEELARFQLYQPCLCMPFDKFHEGIEKLLGRPVWTHEFARPDSLRAELEGRAPKATFCNVVDKLVDLAGDKLIVPIIVEDRMK